MLVDLEQGAAAQFGLFGKALLDGVKRVPDLGQADVNGATTGAIMRSQDAGDDFVDEAGDCEAGFTAH